MKIAYTELNDILNKVFEGFGFPLGDYEDFAKVISWLEFHNWPILERVLQAAPSPHALLPILNPEDSHSASINVQKNVPFMASSLAIDLAYVKSLQLEGTTADVWLLNPILPDLLIPNLLSIGKRNYDAQLIWHQGRKRIYWVLLEKGATYPNITVYSGDPLPINLAVHIEVGTAVYPYSPPLEVTDSHLITPAELEDRFKNNIVHGLEIEADLWQQLRLLSKNVLVEATQESRNKGAGENA